MPTTVYHKCLDLKSEERKLNTAQTVLVSNACHKLIDFHSELNSPVQPPEPLGGLLGGHTVVASESEHQKVGLSLLNWDGWQVWHYTYILRPWASQSISLNT